MNVNGVDLSPYLITNRINRPLTPRMSNRSVNVPGRAGLYHIRNEIQERYFFVDVTIIASNRNELQELKRIISAILVHEQDVPITFPDEPDKTYYGSLVGDTNMLEIARLGQGSLVFFCSDPFAYGKKKDVGFVDGEVLINYEATAPTSPIITITFTGSASELIVTHPLGTLRVIREFTSGDEVVIDCTKRLVTYNGNRAMNLLDISSRWVKLTPGDNLISINPSANAEITYRERWL